MNALQIPTITIWPPDSNQLIIDRTKNFFNESNEFITRIRQLIELTKDKILLERGNIDRLTTYEIVEVACDISNIINSIPEKYRSYFKETAFFFINNPMHPEDERIFNLI